MSVPKNYANSGFDIQYAMVDQLQRSRSSGVDNPQFLLWDGFHVKTSDAIPVPPNGVVTASFRSVQSSVKQGFDLKLDGWIDLKDGERISLLRTWKDDIHEDTVRYSFRSQDGILRFWNVYERAWPNGSVTEEKWTGNAGFWVEELGANQRIYHCSHGAAETPDFGALIVELLIEPV